MLKPILFKVTSFVGGDGTISTLSFPKVATEELGLYQLKVDLEGERIESDPIALRIIGNTPAQFMNF